VLRHHLIVFRIDVQNLHGLKQITEKNTHAEP
jgi:hypothetical protein